MIGPSHSRELQADRASGAAPRPPIAVAARFAEPGWPTSALQRAGGNRATAGLIRLFRAEERRDGAPSVTLPLPYLAAPYAKLEADAHAASAVAGAVPRLTGDHSSGARIHAGDAPAAVNSRCGSSALAAVADSPHARDERRSESPRGQRLLARVARRRRSATVLVQRQTDRPQGSAAVASPPRPGRIIREWRAPDGVAIEIEVGPSVRRLGLEQTLPSGTEVGLSGWHRAHSAGPGVGAESGAAIRFAPPEVNLEYQNTGVERFVRDFNRAKATGVRLVLRTVTTTHEGTLRLASITYRLSAARGTEDPRSLFEVGLNVANVRDNPKVTLSPPEIFGDWTEYLEPGRTVAVRPRAGRLTRGVRVAIGKVRGQLARGAVRTAARWSAGKAIKGLPIVMVLLTLKNARADVEHAQQGLEEMKRVRPRIDEDGLEQLPSAADLRNEHLGFEVQDERDYLAESAAVALFFLAAGHETKDIQTAGRQIGRALENLHQRASELATLDAYLHAYVTELDQILVEVGERYAALRAMYSGLWADMKKYDYLPGLVEILLQLYLAVEAVMKAVGGLESRLESVRDAYVYASTDARNEWFQIHRDYVTWAPHYIEAMRVREGIEVHLEPMSYDDLEPTIAVPAERAR
jgi:Bacterial toxin 4